MKKEGEGKIEEENQPQRHVKGAWFVKWDTADSGEAIMKKQSGKNKRKKVRGSCEPQCTVPDDWIDVL